MLKYVILIILLIVIYICFLTPYPFVWLLKSKKEEITNKSPKNIEDILKKTISIKNLPYDSKYPQATFDLYLPQDKKVKTMIVWVHGGSFISGSSIGMRNFGPMLASRGYCVCAMNYAYAPRYSFPIQIRQVDEMIEYGKNYLKQEHLVGIKDVVLGGDSAGANIAASYSTMYKNDILAKKAKVELKNQLSLKGLLLFCGPYDFSEDLNKEEFKHMIKFFKYIGWSYLGHKSWIKRNEKILASPLINIHANFPPAYICDGKKYSFMWQGKKLASIMEQQGIYVKTRFYEDMVHEFQFDFVKNPSEAMQVFNDSIEFLEVIIGKE